MHAFLVCGQDQDGVGEQIENLLQSHFNGVTHENRLDLNPSAKKETKLPTLTIDDVRFISNWFSQASQNPRAVVVHGAQCMTIPAQQAFLKTLEEPGENNYIILAADSETPLLPTIRSRCKIIRLPAETSVTNVDSTSYSVGILQRLTEIGNKSPSKRLTILYELFSEFSGKKYSPNQQGNIPRPDALKFMEHIISSLHHPSSIIHHPSSTILQTACLSHRRLKNNLNVQLALQQFIFDIPIQ